MHRSQFTFYESFFEAISHIKKKQDRADAYDAICAYALRGIEPDIEFLPDSAAIAFISARPNLDASKKKAENGIRGGKVKKEESKPETNGKQTGSKPEANGKQEESLSEKENEKEGEKEKEYECITPISPLPGEESKPEANDDDDDGFNSFWDAYPVKSGYIDRAYMEYRKVMDTGVTLSDLLDALDWQSELFASQGARYTPSAEKWLHNRGWTAKKGDAGPKSFGDMWQSGVTE